MAATYWIKLYHEILRDPKMGRLPDRAWRRAIELFLMAGEAGDDGLLPDTADIAWQLRLDEETLQDDLELLAEHGILTETEDGWLVTNFAARQAPVSDAERQARYRERLRKAQYHGDEPVTNRNAEADKIREEAEADSSVTAAADDLAGALFEEVDSCGSIITPTTAEAWLDAIEDHRGWLVEQDIHDAFLSAAKANVPRPSPAYIRKILDRCGKQGVRPGGKQSDASRASPKLRTVTIVDQHTGERRTVEARE